jgi:putative transposase
MAKPSRLPSVRSEQTCFISFSTYQKRSLFQVDNLAELFVRVLFSYRDQSKFTLQAFVLMPDHFHLLITPGLRMTLERSIQYIKGGFSHQVKVELGRNSEVWQRGFTDRRVRDRQEYLGVVDYIHQNPVEARLVAEAKEYRYSSLNTEFRLDPPPPHLSG